MKNDNRSSLSGLLTSICHRSFAICHLSEKNPCQLRRSASILFTTKTRRREESQRISSRLRVFVVRFFWVAHLHTANATRRQSKVRFCSRRRAQRPCNIPTAWDS